MITSFEDILSFLDKEKLTREQRIELLNRFNRHINAFPIEDCVIITQTGGILANGKEMSLEQREAFLQGARSLKSNTAFNLIADQVVYQAMKKGLHDATEMDHLYFSKTAMYFVDLFKRYLETLDKLA